MIGFVNDYSEGAHERILARLGDENRVRHDPYGEDAICDEARGYIRSALGADCDIHFLVGGTQTNATVISALLRPHQGVISADIGHIATHESGAIEATGHKVLTLPSVAGKLTASQIEALAAAHRDDPTREHAVQPAMVYLSHPTEVGTIYSKAELEAIAAVCRKFGLLLYIDGARMGCALTAPGNDVTLADLARLTDAFYIGGTKMGALFGEALVLPNAAAAKDFRYIIKQKGGRLAKGWLLGAQFAELFRDGLYERLAAHANKMASQLAAGIEALGLSFLAPGATNQVFPVLPVGAIEALQNEFAFLVWEKADDRHMAVRLVTSWATEEAAVETFLAALRGCLAAKEG